MTWYRGFLLLAATRTGRTMIGGAVAVSAGFGAVINRATPAGTRRSVASGAALGLAQLGAIAYLGHRLVRAGEELAIKSGLGDDPEPES